MTEMTMTEKVREISDALNAFFEAVPNGEQGILTHEIANFLQGHGVDANPHQVGAALRNDSRLVMERRREGWCVFGLQPRSVPALEIKKKHFAIEFVAGAIEFCRIKPYDPGTFKYDAEMRSFIRRFFTLDLMQEETLMTFVRLCAAGESPVINLWGPNGSGKTSMSQVLGYMCPRAILIDSIEGVKDMERWLYLIQRQYIGKQPIIWTGYEPHALAMEKGAAAIYLPAITLANKAMLDQYRALHDFGF